MTIYPFRMPAAIYCGRNAIHHLPAELKGYKKVFVITDQGIMKTGLYDRLKEYLIAAKCEWHLWSGVETEPSPNSIDQTADAIRKYDPDAIIALGGGSVIDTAKIANIAAFYNMMTSNLMKPGSIRGKGLPLFSLPTTSGTGSEVTPIAITSIPGEVLKVGIVDPYIMPTVAIIDSTFTETLPPRLTASTGIDALCHAVEALLSIKSSPLTEPYCLASIRKISSSLRTAVRMGSDPVARENMSYGSLYAGIGLGNAGVGAVHAISYPIGGRYPISHGECIAIFMVEVLKWLLPAAIEPLVLVAKAMGEKVDHLASRQAAIAAIESIERLIDDVKLPMGLKAYHVDPSMLSAMAGQASGIERLIKNSPRILKDKEIEQIYNNLLHI